MTATTEGPGVFLLGVGAQKAGTTWLHAQLDRRRDADFGFLKEYHVHDALTLPAAGFSNRRRPSWLKPRTWRRQRFLDRPERYYAYFAARLRRRGIRLTGDITPSYSGLSVDTLRTIRRGFDRYAIPGTTGVSDAGSDRTDHLQCAHATPQTGAERQRW